MKFSTVVQQRIDAWNEASLAFGPLLRGEAGDWVQARRQYAGALAMHPTPEGVSSRTSTWLALPPRSLSPT